MRYHLLTVVVLLLAVLCYAKGLDGGGLVLFFIGALLEIVFWLRVVQGPRHPPLRLLTPPNSRR